MPNVTVNMELISVVLAGAALPRAGYQWALGVSEPGCTPAPAHVPSLVAVQPRAEKAPARRRTPAITRPFAALGELSLVDNRKYVHMTRVNAGGDGASGPQPEREPV